MKLDPPSDLQSNVTSHYCVLTWRVSPALEPLTAILSYELAFKKEEEGWEVTLDPLLRSLLSPGSRGGGPTLPHRKMSVWTRGRGCPQSPERGCAHVCVSMRRSAAVCVHGGG